MKQLPEGDSAGSKHVAIYEYTVNECQCRNIGLLIMNLLCRRLYNNTVQ
jgi:hypothetical protein